MMDDFFWAQWNDGVSIGVPNGQGSQTFSYEPQGDDGDEIELMIKDGSIYSIFDTGSNAIYFSSVYYASFIRKLFDYVKGKNWELKDGLLNTECYEFPPLYFLFDGKWIKIDATDYVVDYS